jgi:hypothetical protein
MQIRAKEMINETWEGLEDPAVFIMRVRRFTILPPTVGWMRMDLRLSCSKEQASTSCGDADFAPYPGTLVHIVRCMTRTSPTFWPRRACSWCDQSSLPVRQQEDVQNPPSFRPRHVMLDAPRSGCANPPCPLLQSPPATIEPKVRTERRRDSNACDDRNPSIDDGG